MVHVKGKAVIVCEGPIYQYWINNGNINVDGKSISENRFGLPISNAIRKESEVYQEFTKYTLGFFDNDNNKQIREIPHIGTNTHLLEKSIREDVYMIGTLDVSLKEVLSFGECSRGVRINNQSASFTKGEGWLISNKHGRYAISPFNHPDFYLTTKGGILLVQKCERPEIFFVKCTGGIIILTNSDSTWRKLTCTDNKKLCWEEYSTIVKPGFQDIWRLWSSLRVYGIGNRDDCIPSVWYIYTAASPPCYSTKWFVNTALFSDQTIRITENLELKFNNNAVIEIFEDNTSIFQSNGVESNTTEISLSIKYKAVLTPSGIRIFNIAGGELLEYIPVTYEGPITYYLQIVNYWRRSAKLVIGPKYQDAKQICECIFQY